MAATLAHRGPDDAGRHDGERCQLAHRRLTIIDLSRRARQPLSDERDRIWLSYNGEIYNFVALRQELLARRHRFRSSSDGEVLVHLYEERRERLLGDLEGMFAFAIWDENEERLLLARDRLGIKPLYYAWGGARGDLLVFASEVKAILASGLVETRPNLEAVDSYLAYRHPVGALTMFEGIHALPAGHYLVAEGGDVRIERYWDLELPAAGEDLGEATYLQRVRELVGDAVEQRLISDVPLGAYLSGGLDSSVVVAEMAERMGPRVKTYAIGFGDETDELSYARLVAERYDTDHTEVLLDRARYLELLPALIEQRDAPLAVPNEVALFELSRTLKQDITVVLSGEGADEIFGGYGDYMRTAFDYAKARRLRRLPTPLRRLLAGGMETKYGGRRDFDGPTDHFLAGYHWFTSDERASLLAPEVRSRITGAGCAAVAAVFDRHAGHSYDDRVLYTLERVHLQNLLERADAMTMAASVEARVPFVDHRLVEFVAGIPHRYRMRWRSPLHRARAALSYSDVFRERDDVTKYVLRRAYADRLPREIVERRKIGFKVPLERSFHAAMLAFAREILLSDEARSRGVLDVDAVARWLDDAHDPRGEFGQKVWMLANLELWFRRYFPDGHTLAQERVGAK